jgi:hypothetical protein
MAEGTMLSAEEFVGLLGQFKDLLARVHEANVSNSK